MKIDMHIVVCFLSFVKCFIDFYFAYKFINVFFQPKVKSLLADLSGIAISTVLLFLINSFNNSILNSIFMLIIIFVRCKIVLNGNWRTIFVTSLIAFTIDLFCEFMTIAIGNIILQYTPYLRGTDTLQIFLIESSVIIYSFISYYLIKVLKKKKLKILYPSKYLLILPVTSIGSMYYILYLHNNSCSTYTFFSNIIYVAVVIGLGMANIIVLAVHDEINKKAALEQEVEKMRTQQITTEISYKQQESCLQELRRISHDFKKHLICLSGLIQSNSGVEEYISNLINEIDNSKFQNLNRSDNNALNIILYEKEQQCLKLNIKFEIEIEYNLLSFLSYKDTCTIFANALDNAISACGLSLDFNLEAYINLRIFRVNSMLFIEIYNTKVNDIVIKGNRIKSTKKSSGSHGYGLMNIKDAVSHYNGTMDFSFTENIFRLSLCMPILEDIKQ
ncbi:MAG: GHKL domain-containing protein [Anaerocolumna sp.]